MEDNNMDIKKIRIIELAMLFSGLYNDRLFKGEKYYVFAKAHLGIKRNIKGKKMDYYNLWAFYPEENI
jgi:hypothetical protein